jgi:hypothetical protein
MRTIEERFWSKVKVLGPDDCHEWQACTGKKGYGRFAIDGKLVYAHRYILELHLGRNLRWDDEVKEMACHTCDNPACVNIRHLFLGDNSSNQQDSVNKGRWSNGNAKKSKCKRNHEFTSENTRINPRGQRVCRECDRELQAARRAAKK